MLFGTVSGGWQAPIVFLKMTFAPSHMQINDLQASRVAPFDGEGTEATCPPRGYYLLPITRGSSKSWHSQRPDSCDIGHPASDNVRVARTVGVSCAGV